MGRGEERRGERRRREEREGSKAERISALDRDRASGRARVCHEAREEQRRRVRGNAREGRRTEGERGVEIHRAPVRALLSVPLT